MSEASTTETPTQTVNEILDALGITRIVFVDDLFANKVELADAQEAQLSLSTEKALEAIGDPDLRLTDDPDIRRQDFERFWNDQTAKIQEDIARRLSVAADASPSVRPEDIGAARALSDIIGKDRLLTLSPQEWNVQRDTILGEAKAARMLLLFDQDLRDDGGTIAGGITIVAGILASGDSPDIMCGLLTHTVSVADEIEAWKSLSTEHNVDRDRFIVIAKDNLRSDQLQFVRMLKLVALAPDCRKVKDRVHQILLNSTTDAAKEVAEIDVFEFEHAVLRIANSEGVDELDMLFRLFAIFQRTKVRELAALDADLGPLIRRLRGISNIPVDSPAKPQLSTWKLQQREMYEPADHINALHLPIEIGDIFVKTGGDGIKSYILLGQPCDLMVRPGGERKPKVIEVLLGEIQAVENPTRHDELIPYFGNDPTIKHFVRLKRIHTVPVIVLDLCVFNADGVSRLVDTCPEAVRPAWRARHEVIKKALISLLTEYNTFGRGKAKDAVLDELRTTLFQSFPPVVGKGGLFKPKYEQSNGQSTLVFNCTRVKRLYRPRAAALALYYAASFSRPAFDRDLGDVVEDD